MGYIGQSRSERSQQAIDEGLVTKNQLSLAKAGGRARSD